LKDKDDFSPGGPADDPRGLGIPFIGLLNAGPSLACDALVSGCGRSLFVLVGGSALFCEILVPKLKALVDALVDDDPKMGVDDGLEVVEGAGAEEEVGKAEVPKADLKWPGVEDAAKLNPPVLCSSLSFGGTESVFPSNFDDCVPNGLLLALPNTEGMEGLVNGKVGTPVPISVLVLEPGSKAVF